MISAGGKEFASKAELTKAVQAVLHSAPVGMIPKKHFSFFLDLLRRHPEAEQKIGVGVRDFYIFITPWKRRGFKLVRIDGTETDWSYKECLTPASKRQKTAWAFRRSVSSQIIEFRDKVFGNANKIVCPVTGKWISKSEAHVDHVAPDTFNALLKAFLEERVLTENMSLVAENFDGLIGEEIADLDLEIEWQAFHAQHAVLRVVSAEVNLRNL